MCLSVILRKLHFFTLFTPLFTLFTPLFLHSKLLHSLVENLEEKSMEECNFKETTLLELHYYFKEITLLEMKKTHS